MGPPPAAATLTHRRRRSRWHRRASDVASGSSVSPARPATGSHGDSGPTRSRSTSNLKVSSSSTSTSSASATVTGSAQWTATVTGTQAVAGPGTASGSLSPTRRRPGGVRPLRVRLASDSESDSDSAGTPSDRVRRRAVRVRQTQARRRVTPAAALPVRHPAGGPRRHGPRASESARFREAQWQPERRRLKLESGSRPGPGAPALAVSGSYMLARRPPSALAPAALGPAGSGGASWPSSPGAPSHASLTLGSGCDTRRAGGGAPTPLPVAAPPLVDES